MRSSNPRYDPPKCRCIRYGACALTTTDLPPIRSLPRQPPSWDGATMSDPASTQGGSRSEKELYDVIPKIIIPFASALAVTQEVFRLLYLVLIMTSLASPASSPSQKLSISDSFACPVLNLARLFYFGSRVRDIVIGFARFYRYPLIAMGAPI